MDGIYLLGILSDQDSNVKKERGKQLPQFVATEVVPATATVFIMFVLGASYINVFKSDVHTLHSPTHFKAVYYPQSMWILKPL